MSQTPSPTHCMFPLLFVWGVCLFFAFPPCFGDQALDRGLCLQSGEQTDTLRTRFLRLSSIFHFPNYDTWLPFGHGSSSPFPRMERVPPGCRKEAIDGVFLRTGRREHQRRGLSLARWEGPWGPPRVAGKQSTHAPRRPPCPELDGEPLERKGCEEELSTPRAERTVGTQEVPNQGVSGPSAMPSRAVPRYRGEDGAALEWVVVFFLAHELKQIRCCPCDTVTPTSVRLGLFSPVGKTDTQQKGERHPSLPTRLHPPRPFTTIISICADPDLH